MTKEQELQAKCANLAAPALAAYAMAAWDDDREYSAEVWELAMSAVKNPDKRKPD